MSAITTKANEVAAPKSAVVKFDRAKALGETLEAALAKYWAMGWDKWYWEQMVLECMEARKEERAREIAFYAGRVLRGAFPQYKQSQFGESEFVYLRTLIEFEADFTKARRPKAEVVLKGVKVAKATA